MKPRYGCKARAPPQGRCDFRRQTLSQLFNRRMCHKQKEKVMKTNTRLHSGIGAYIDGLG